MLFKPKVFILDVDGVMTNGQFLYSKEGKEMKVFGPDDNDALCLLKPYLEIRFVTGDKKGFKISKKRINDDMKFKTKEPAHGASPFCSNTFEYFILFFSFVMTSFKYCRI